MRTEAINIYKFSELSEQAKQKAIEWYRSDLDTSYIYNEALESVKAFLNLLPISESRNNWLKPDFNSLDDVILNLHGLRLRTWIMNNIYDSICKPTFKKSIEGAHPHRLTKVNRYSNGNVTSHVYSSFKRDYECHLTGICYDIILLQPIIDHIKTPHPSVTFEDLINMCFTSLEKDLKSEETAMYEDANCIEMLEANAYEFTENGKIY